jgi:hypothetical protein
MRATVSGADMADASATFPATPGADGNGVVQGVPAGTGRWLTLEGLDGSNTVIYRGGLENITVTAGQDEDVGVVYLAPEGGIAPTLPLYDSFASPPDANLTRWGILDAAGCTHSTSAGFVQMQLSASAMNELCSLTIQDSAQVRVLSADVRVTAYTQLAGDIQARIAGFLYATAASNPSSLAGNVHAQIRVEDFDAGSGTGTAQGIIIRCTDDNCATFTVLEAATVGTVQLNQTHSLSLGWNGVTTIVFQVDDQNPVGFDVSGAAPFAGPANGYTPDFVVQARARNAAVGNMTVQWDLARCARSDGSPCQAKAGTAVQFDNLPNGNLTVFAFDDAQIRGIVSSFPVASTGDVVTVLHGNYYNNSGYGWANTKAAVMSGTMHAYLYTDGGLAAAVAQPLSSTLMTIPMGGGLFQPINTAPTVSVSNVSFAENRHLYCVWHHLTGVDPIVDGIWTGLFSYTGANPIQGGNATTDFNSGLPEVAGGGTYNLSCLIDMDNNFDWNAPAVTSGDYLHQSTDRPVIATSLTDTGFTLQ